MLQKFHDKNNAKICGGRQKLKKIANEIKFSSSNITH